MNEQPTVYAALVYLTREQDLMPLVVKNRPPQLAGKMMFPGGHVEEGELPIEAASREFNEECGLHVDTNRMVLLGVVRNPGAEIHIFGARENEADIAGDNGAIRQMTEEPVVIVNALALPPNVADHVAEYVRRARFELAKPQAEFLDVAPRSWAQQPAARIRMGS